MMTCEYNGENKTHATTAWGDAPGPGRRAARNPHRLLRRERSPAAVGPAGLLRQTSKGAALPGLGRTGTAPLGASRSSTDMRRGYFSGLTVVCGRGHSAQGHTDLI